MKFVDPIVVAERHLLPAWLNEQRQLIYVVGSIREQSQVQPDTVRHAPDPESVPVASTTPSPQATVEPTTPNRTAPAVWDLPPWPCISTAETSGKPAMGPTYWTVYGVVIDVIQDYGTPEEQDAIFNGTASLQTQTDVVARFAAARGFSGWGVLTRRKCNL